MSNPPSKEASDEQRLKQALSQVQALEEKTKDFQKELASLKKTIGDVVQF